MGILSCFLIFLLCILISLLVGVIIGPFGLCCLGSRKLGLVSVVLDLIWYMIGFDIDSVGVYILKKNKQ